MVFRINSIYNFCIMANLPRLKVCPWPSHTKTEARQLENSSNQRATHKQASFKDFTANALTTFDAGLAAIFFISNNPPQCRISG